MTHLNSETRLTDELERQLMAQAIEDQMRFRPIKALKTFFAAVTAKFGSENRDASRETIQTAN